MINRRQFIQAACSLSLVPLFTKAGGNNQKLLGVNGWIDLNSIKYILPHEHIMVDFIGADKITKDRYDADEVFKTALPKLTELKKAGCEVMFECTPAYIGRDVQLLQRLSSATGINIITNTGYYGASKEKYYPKHVYNETAEQLAQRWIAEFETGIEGTTIKPGFIKLGVDAGPLTEAQRKTIHAAALTHLKTGLTIGIHTGNGAAATEELTIIQQHAVAANAMVWIHAQNEKGFSYFKTLAEKGVWIEFDGVSKDNLQQNLQFLQYMKINKLLNKTLVSQDSGWYHAGEPNGGNYNGYTAVFTDFIPLLLKNDFTQKEIDLVFKRNPVKAYGIGKKLA